MNYWLLKTEPGTYSWDDLVKKGSDMWDGVRNYQARNNIRQMKVGDMLLIYHSVKNQAVVGLATVIKEHYPDPTAKEGDWSVVDIKPVRKLAKPITLPEIKANTKLSQMVLLRNRRLSVQPVKKEEVSILENMAGEKFK